MASPQNQNLVINQVSTDPNYSQGNTTIVPQQSSVARKFYARPVETAEEEKDGGGGSPLPKKAKAGSIAYHDGKEWAVIPPSEPKSILTIGLDSLPEWISRAEALGIEQFQSSVTELEVSTIEGTGFVTEDQLAQAVAGISGGLNQDEIVALVLSTFDQRLKEAAKTHNQKPAAKKPAPKKPAPKKPAPKKPKTKEANPEAVEEEIEQIE